MKTELRLVLFGKREPGRSMFLNLFRTYFHTTVYDPTLRQVEDFKHRQSLAISEDGTEIREYNSNYDLPESIFCQGWDWSKTVILPNHQNHLYLIHAIDFSNHKSDQLIWALMNYELESTVNAVVLALDCAETDIKQVYEGFMQEINDKIPEVIKLNLVVVFNRCVRDDDERQRQMSDVIGSLEFPRNYFFFKDLYDCENLQDHFRYNLAQMKALISHVQRLTPLMHEVNEEMYRPERYNKMFYKKQYDPNLMSIHLEEEVVIRELPREELEMEEVRNIRIEVRLKKFYAVSMVYAIMTIVVVIVAMIVHYYY